MGIRAQEANRRFHIVDLRRKDGRVAQSIVDGRQRVTAAHQAFGLRAIRLVAGLPAAAVNPYDQRLRRSRITRDHQVEQGAAVCRVCDVGVCIEIRVVAHRCRDRRSNDVPDLDPGRTTRQRRRRWCRCRWESRGWRRTETCGSLVAPSTTRERQERGQQSNATRHKPSIGRGTHGTATRARAPG